MSGFKDLTGQRFGRLTVLERAGGGHSVTWKCQCDCGGMAIVSSSHLTHQDTKSCGCLRKEATSKQFRTHGAATHGKRSREYNIWLAMHDRCNNKNNTAFNDYGGRGITICERWENSFESFLADMGHCPKGHTIDRIDNDKGYSPGNCRWATYKQQNNNRRDNIHISFRGQTLTIPEWSERTGISAGAIRQRLKTLKWSIERALTTPARRVA